MDLQSCHKGTVRNVLTVPLRLFVLGITLLMLFLSLVTTELEAAVTISIQRANRTITLNRNGDFGVSSSSGVAMPQGGMTAVEIAPMMFDTAYSVSVPVSRIGNNLTDNVADDGTITKTLVSGSSTYVWRVVISGGKSSERATARNQLLNNLQDVHTFTESLGGSTGYLSHTSNSGRKLKVTLVEGTLGNTTSNTSYVWRNMTLVIDLKNVRYSGSYTGTLNSAITCPGLIN